MMRLALAASVAALSVLEGVAVRAGEIPNAVVTLEATTPFAPGQVWSGAPPRFILLEDGQVFVGGSSGVASGRLEREDMKALDAELEAVRKAAGIGSSVVFGEGEERYRLRVGKGKAIEIVATGDPAKANPSLRPLAALVVHLASYDHPSLRPYQPIAYAASAREGSHLGGCRSWTLPVSPSEITTGVRSVPASTVETWMGGVFPTAACVADKSYLVTLRPLLPSEKP
jgi:hypothetical protein